MLSMTMPRQRRIGDLAEVLQRAVAAQILSAEQAQAVLDAERTRAGGDRRRPVIEAVGYLGGLLALSSAVTLVI